MTHVSRNPVHKDVFFEILNSLYWLLADIKKPEEMKQFLGDFFTKTERLMLAKRLALAGMIIEGYEMDTIRQVLKVSTATIYRTREMMDKSGEGLKSGIRRLLHKESFEKFLKDLFERPHSSGFHPLADS